MQNYINVIIKKMNTGELIAIFPETLNELGLVETLTENWKTGELNYSLLMELKDPTLPEINRMLDFLYDSAYGGYDFRLATSGDFEQNDAELAPIYDIRTKRRVG